MAVGYSMSNFTLEKIVEPVFYARRIFDVDPYIKNIIEPIYNVCPIFDVGFNTRENHRADV